MIFVTRQRRGFARFHKICFKYVLDTISNTILGMLKICLKYAKSICIFVGEVRRRAVRIPRFVTWASIIDRRTLANSRATVLALLVRPWIERTVPSKNSSARALAPACIAKALAQDRAGREQTDAPIFFAIVPYWLGLLFDWFAAIYTGMVSRTHSQDWEHGGGTQKRIQLCPADIRRDQIHSDAGPGRSQRFKHSVFK